MSKQIGVGVISLGWMGRLHARSYRALAERYPGLEADVQLVAACDPVEAARAQPSHQHQLGHQPVVTFPSFLGPRGSDLPAKRGV